MISCSHRGFGGAAAGHSSNYNQYTMLCHKAWTGGFGVNSRLQQVSSRSQQVTAVTIDTIQYTVSQGVDTCVWGQQQVTAG